VIVGLVDEAVRAGARQDKACELLGLDARTLQRWKRMGVGDDLRAGPRTAPRNALTPQERQRILEIANRPEHRDLSPKQIVPRLADQGCYIASESSFYRVLRADGQVQHRERSRPAQHSRPRELAATRPNQVWTWDITYLLSPVKGAYFYLYLVLDVFSRKIVGWDVHERESAEHAGALIAATCRREGVRRDQVALHQDNGAPMKCGTFLALLQGLGVAASFSRPGVSDDNPFVEALFRTLKYRPEYPDSPFASLDAAREFIRRFVHWYNTQHLHGNIRFVTPAVRHAGEDCAILARRERVYEQARARRPERWSRSTRNWSPVQQVVLNPQAGVATENAA
jgi:transposase InsO family protein